MQAQATFSHGNREVTVVVVGSSVWSKDAMQRSYFDLKFSGGRLEPIAKFYEVLEGTTRDDTFTVAGRTFGFQLGISCDSKTKRAAEAEAIKALIQQITA